MPEPGRGMHRRFSRDGRAVGLALDPAPRRAYTATAAEGLREVKSGILKTENPALEMPLAEIFSS